MCLDRFKCVLKIVDREEGEGGGGGERVERGSMKHGQVFLKERGLALFLFNLFKVYHFLHLEITLPFAKLCYAFEEKIIIFFCYHNFMEKGHSKLFKKNMKI